MHPGIDEASGAHRAHAGALRRVREGCDAAGARLAMQPLLACVALLMRTPLAPILRLGFRLLRGGGNAIVALLKAAVCCGAILAGASDADVAKCELYAQKIGLAFQVRPSHDPHTTSLTTHSHEQPHTNNLTRTTSHATSRPRARHWP